MSAGTPLSELVQEYYTLSLSIGCVLSLEQCQQLAVDAARHYGAYGAFAVKQAAPTSPDAPNVPAKLRDVGDIGKITYPGKITVGANICVTLGEWAVIKPLFALYVERQNAMALEASRGLGLDVFGRSVSEINADILNVEAAMQSMAFFQPIQTVA